MRPAQPPEPPGPGTQRTRFGRICNPPLRTCPRFPRRGRCPHRPAGLCVRAALAGCTRCHSCCRGALYMRPAQPPEPPGPGTQRTRFGRICNPPLRTCPGFLVGADAHIGPPGCVSEPPSPACTRCHSCCRGALYMRPAQPPQPPGPGTQRTRFGRIYNPPLRTCPRFPRRGRCPHRPAGCVSEPPSPAAPAAIPAVGAHCICALPSRRNHQGPEHNAPGSGGYAIRPYAPAPRFPRRGGLYGRPGPGPDSRRGPMVLFAVGARSVMAHPTRRYGPAFRSSRLYAGASLS